MIYVNAHCHRSMIAKAFDLLSQMFTKGSIKAITVWYFNKYFLEAWLLGEAIMFIDYLFFKDEYYLKLMVTENLLATADWFAENKLESRLKKRCTI